MNDRVTARPVRAREAVFLLVTWLAFLGLAEAATRLLWTFECDGNDQSMRYADDPKLLYEYRPNVRNEFLHTNAAGVIADREFAVPKPPGVYRIASVADSVGVLSENHRTYARILQERLDDPGSSGCRVEVLNFAVYGYDSRQELIAIRDKILRYEPDLILLGYCSNDHLFYAGLRKVCHSGHPTRLGRRLHSLFLTFLQDRYYRARAKWSFEHPTFDGPRELFSFLRDLREARRIETLILFFPPLQESFETRDLALREPLRLAREAGLPFLAPGDLFGHGDFRGFQWVPGDILHFNDEGHRIVAERAHAEIVRRFHPCGR